MAGKVSAALTPAQITYLYNGGLGLSPASVNAYLTAPAVDFLYEFTNGAALGTDSSANAITLTAVGTISQGSGPSAVTLTTSLAPTSASVAPSASTTTTATFTATNLSAGIVPSCTGMPIGVTATYGTNPVAQTGGTSLITLTAAAGATLGGPITISCIGTSGATVSAAATFALTVTAAPAGTLTLGTISTYSAQSLTGSADWVNTAALVNTATGAQSWNDRKLGGTIFTAGASETLIGTVSGNIGFPALSWTDGTVTATSSNGTAPEMTAAAGNGNTFTLTSDGTTRTLTVFAGVGYAAGSFTVTASSNVAGVASVQHTITIAATNTGRAFTFTFQNAGTVTITLASTGAGIALSAAKVI